MRLITSITAMQRLAQRHRRAGVRVGFVATMGYLHLGHMSLVQRARRLVGPKGTVVVSVYVNPIQFGPSEDFARYPRDLEHDKKLCRAAGVDVFFAPSDREMYPASSGQPFSTFVVERRVSQGMEGISRPDHFRGVTTIVAKLINIVLPEVAVFGEKDFQQAAVIQRMVRDLNFPVKIALSPTVREADGLALSSRNKYLSREERPQAAALWRAIQFAKGVVATARQPVLASRLRRRVAEFIHRQPAARVDYVAFFEPQSFDPVRRVKAGVRMALAVRLGKTRLIDNAVL